MSTASQTPDGSLQGFENPADFERPGLPPAAVAQIAAVIASQAGARPPGLLLDLGGGTGAIGHRLAAFPGVCYLTLALSLPRLRRFARRSSAGEGSAFLARADANLAWPLRDGCVSLFFLTRAAHLLLPESLVAEILRTAHPAGSAVVLGRVRREPSSVRATLRRALHRLLSESGIPSRSGEAAHPLLAAAL
ncbi:MAG TPA: hypothetical protein VMM92_05920, partial [Thermoanaerobaculia bacterium]|nr:hypothetical protein [Thermoanaerobaculia bacterium]